MHTSRSDVSLVLSARLGCGLKNKTKVIFTVNLSKADFFPPVSLRQHFSMSSSSFFCFCFVQRYRQTGKIPDTPRDVEKFSEDMVKAPCDQPGSVLPAWCKVLINAQSYTHTVHTLHTHLSESQEE